jgi:hypothetical protein
MPGNKTPLATQILFQRYQKYRPRHRLLRFTFINRKYDRKLAADTFPAFY